MDKFKILAELIEELNKLNYHDNIKLDALRRRTKLFIRKFFGEESHYSEELDRISFYPIAAPANAVHKSKAWEEGKGEMMNFLKTIREDLELSERLEESMENSGGTIDDITRVLKISIYDFILKNPTAYKKDSRGITIQRKAVVKKRDNFQCQLCGVIFNEQDLEIDHIYPYALGGSNEEINLMAVCRGCNLNKGQALNYYRSEEGRLKLMLNIEAFVKTLPLIQDFRTWLKKSGDKRHRLR